MSRILPVKFSMSYKISFSTNIHRHNVYKSGWKAEKGEKLDCRKDDRDEASKFDNHVTAVYKQEKNSTLVGRVPKDCLTLVDNFLNIDQKN